MYSTLSSSNIGKCTGSESTPKEQSFMFKAIIISTIFILTSCESMSKRERIILNYTPDKVKTYESNLVLEDQYTTNGKYYHHKYYKHLIGIARYLIEEKQFTIVKHSIGFYYDKRESTKSKLYLGIDIKIEAPLELSRSTYHSVAGAFIRHYLTDILQVLFSCKSVFREKEIVGIVAGFQWERNGKRELVNIWIAEDDILKYENNMLTLEEVIERNVITDTRGKIIRLKLELSSHSTAF
jgi:hypothetical protein